VVTFTCGAVGYPWRRFLPVTALSGLIWATYAFVIGRIGGTTFANKPWLGLVLALGLAFAVTVTAELGRRTITWRRHSGRPAEPGTRGELCGHPRTQAAHVLGQLVLVEAQAGEDVARRAGREVGQGKPVRGKYWEGSHAGPHAEGAGD
jgi:hypothetical protein